MKIDNDAESIQKQLSRHHDGKFGFVIYRCAYGDDDAWARFMERLTGHVHAQLHFEREGDKIKDSFTWDVQENEPELNGATKEQVRDRFKNWRASIGGTRTLTRYTNCIYADQDVIDSVLNGDKPTSRTYQDRHKPRAYVKVLDDQFEEQPDQLSPEDEPDDELREKLNNGDEGYPPVEGCRRRDVGWVKIAARNLVPRAYNLLSDNGWEITYVRPPNIQND